MLVFTLRTAKYSAGPAGYKGLQAMLAQADRFLRVRQHEAEHHLYAEDQRMKSHTMVGLSSRAIL